MKVMRDIIQKNEGELTVLRIIGFLILLLGVISLIISVFFIKADVIPSVIAISFFVTMLGYSFAFPSLLEGNEGLSTMRIIVFMITNVICMLLLKIGWANDINSLENIGLNEYWMGVIAFVFGAKAVQSFFESSMAVPKEKQNKLPRTGMAAVEFTNADLAKLAVEQNQQFLKVKFPNIASVSDTVGDLNQKESHVVAIYLNDNISEGIPDRLEVRMPDGSVKTIATEIVPGVGSGEIHINQLDEIGNLDAHGSVCCIVETEDGGKKIVTAGHVYSKGNSKNYGGKLNDTDQIEAQINRNVVGNWFFQLINSKNDVALVNIKDFISDADYKSFAGKDHYAITDNDVGNTLVKLISKISGEREGFILDYNNAWDVEYNTEVLQKNKIILIGSTNNRKNSTTLSKKGDSGGCVFEPKSGNIVGLILGGNDKFTWVLPLSETFNKNKFKLV